MAQPISKSGALISDFPGLLSNSGPAAPADSPGAAADQVNLACLRPGELTARRGFRPVEYDTEESQVGVPSEWLGAI